MRQLVEKVELHDKLNPKIWNKNNTLREEVNEKLHEIIDQFILELYDSDIPIKVLDARLVGSNASFNYTENSDLDVHIIANFNEASCDTNVLSLLYNYFKKNFNNRYDISIHGVPIELYIEDVGSSAVSNGIFSLYKDEWIKFPEPIEIPDIDITQEYSKYESRYNDIVISGDVEEADKLIDELYLLRKDSLSTDGEYGIGNLIFKQFRNDGYLDNLKQMLIDNTTKELSLESLTEAKEDKQKLIDHVGEEDAEYFFKLKDSGRLKPPYSDLYYWLKRKPSELNNYINDVGLTITKSQQRKLDKQGADLLYDEDGWKVYKINTYDSAKYYGKGTKWCISGNYAGQEEQGQYYFNEYLSKGVNGYYFIINPFGEKWCWLDVDAEFKDAPLWDEEDNGVTNTRSVYMPNNFPEGVIDVLPNAEEFFTFPEDIIEEHIANGVLEVDDEVANTLNSYDIYLQDFRFHTLYWNTDAHVKYIIGYIPQMEKLIILNGNDSDIERGTFAGDTGLRVIYLPHTIGIIFKWAFDDATNLSDIYTDMDEDEFKRKYKGNVEEDLHDINIHYDTFQEDAVHKILDEKLNESAYFSSMGGMIEQAADRNPKPEDFFEKPWDALVDPNRFFKEITNNISKDAIQKVDRRINLNDKNNKFYKVLLNFLDAYKIPAYKRDSYTYDKLEPATMVEYSNGVRVPVDGKHTAKLCSRLGIKLPVRIIMKESLHESVNSSKIMDIVNKIIENDLRLRISNNPPKFGKPFFILPDGTFLSGFYAHTNVEEILQDISLSFYDDIDFQTPENYNYSTLLDLGCVRGRIDKVENYIQLPDDRPTSSQIDAIADAIFFAMTSGGSYIGKSGIFIEAPDTEQSRFYSFDDYEPEDIVAKIKRYYSSGILYETYQESVDRTVYNALYAFPKYVEKYGRGSALFELKYKYNLQDDELVWIINKLIDSGKIDMFTRDNYISQLGLEDYEEDIKKVIEEDSKGDWGYHYGDLGNKSDRRGNFGGRNSGGFGTGTYFVGTPISQRDDGGFYKNRPEHKVDFSKYHLFRPRTNEEAYRLHDALLAFNNMEPDFKEEPPSWDEVLAEFEKMSNEYWAPLDNLDDETPSTPVKLNTKPLLQYIRKYINYYPYKITKDDNLMGIAQDIEKELIKEASSFEKSLHNLSSALHYYDEDKLRKIVVAALKDKSDKAPSTLIMQALGYDGIDVRHLNHDAQGLAGLDNFGFGSVIYDLKESIADDKTDSNGKTLSDSQIAYFKDSKVRDSSGRLLPVYHGTKDDFTVFKHGHMNRKDVGYLGDGFYFTDDIDSANSYSKWKRGNDYNSHTMEVYLNITNPIVLEHNQWATADLQDFLGLDLLTDDQKFDFTVNQEISNKLTEEVRKRGYDGIIYHNDFYDETIYVVYNSNQIKSVTNETPTSSDDINESVLEEENEETETVDIDIDDLELLEDLAILEEDIEAMKPHYPNIPENRFQSIIELDPTYKIGSTNAGTYGKWLLSLANKNGGRVNDEEYITDVLKRFEENKKFLKNKDIMGFKTIYDVDDYLSDENNYKEESARQKLRRVQNFVRKTDLIKDADKVFDGNDWVIYVPKTYEASCKLGRGTTWCTATTQSDRYYNMYSGDGPLYININKHDPDEKYQFHFPTEQFMDKNDEEIDVMEFLQNNEELLDFYGDEPYIGMKLREINANNNLASFLSDKTTDEKLGETVTIDNIDDLNELIDILGEIPEESGKMSSFEILVIKNVPKIPNSAFSRGIEANMLKIENVGTIYNSAFAYCNIGTLSIYNVDKIDSASFYDSDVQEVYLEDIGTIEKKAFDGCDFITKLTFNGHISDIKENAFTNYVYGGSKVIIDGKESVKDIPNWILKDGTRVKDHDLDDIPINVILPLLKGNI